MSLPKKILITGAALRTGRAIAFALADAGAELILHANRHFAEVEELKKHLPGSGHSCISGDLANDSDVKKICCHAFECDGIVLNASCYRHNYNGGDPDFDRLLEKVNYLSQTAILESFISGSINKKCGAAVALLDQAVCSSEENPYLDSRRSLWKKMKAFASAYGEYDLRFNAIAPGPMLPPPELGNTGLVKTLPALPLRRSVSLEDAAESVKFLLSCQSLTGSLLFVDCGQSLSNRNGVL